MKYEIREEIKTFDPIPSKEITFIRVYVDGEIVGKINPIEGDKYQAAISFNSGLGNVTFHGCCIGDTPQESVEKSIDDIKRGLAYAQAHIERIAG